MQILLFRPCMRESFKWYWSSLLWSDSNHEFRNEFSLLLILIIKVICSILLVKRVSDWMVEEKIVLWRARRLYIYREYLKIYRKSGSKPVNKSKLNQLLTIRRFNQLLTDNNLNKHVIFNTPPYLDAVNSKLFPKHPSYSNYLSF